MKTKHTLSMKIRFDNIKYPPQKKKILRRRRNCI